MFGGLSIFQHVLWEGRTHLCALPPHPHLPLKIICTNNHVHYLSVNDCYRRMHLSVTIICVTDLYQHYVFAKRNRQSAFSIPYNIDCLVNFFYEVAGFCLALVPVGQRCHIMNVKWAIPAYPQTFCIIKFFDYVNHFTYMHSLLYSIWACIFPQIKKYGI